MFLKLSSAQKSDLASARSRKLRQERRRYRSPPVNTLLHPGVYPLVEANLAYTGQIWEAELTFARDSWDHRL